MGGTVLLTGANGSLGLAFTEYLLKAYPDTTALLTVRNASSSDQHTARMQSIVQADPHPTPRIHVEPLDLRSFANVRTYAVEVSKRVKHGDIPPISAIVCNAFVASMTEPHTLSDDGIELGFQVNYLSQLLLVLLLVDCLDKTNGARVVFLGSISHDQEVESILRLPQYPSLLPEDLEELVKPKPVEPATEAGRGYQRYGTSKICGIMAMYYLDALFKKDPAFAKISALAMDPGAMPESRAMNGIPTALRIALKVSAMVLPWVEPLMPINAYVRTLKKSGRMLVDLSLDRRFAGATGYYNGLNQAESAAQTRDNTKQRVVWDKSLAWMQLKPEETMLNGVFSLS